MRMPLVQNGLLCCKGTYRNPKCKVIGSYWNRIYQHNQHHQVLPHMTLWQNLMSGLGLVGQALPA